jgi:hypothetical protein
MARSRFFDLLQNYAFWLVDTSPSRRLPSFVLGGPAFGFSEISHPEVTVQTATIEQYVKPTPNFAFQGASVAPITLGRGARFYDSSMYTWIDRYIRGEDVSHRTLVLFQHMTASFEAFGGGNQASAFLRDSSASEILRLPGKAWMLYDAIPISYKAGPGLDAKNSDITVSELTIQPVEITEVSGDPSLSGL